MTLPTAADAPPAAEALIREARRLRRRRWAVGAVIVVLAAAAAAFVGGDLGSGPPRTTTASGGHPSGAGTGARSPSGLSPPLARIQYAAEMGVLGPGEVWVADGLDFYLTRNDGESWQSLHAPGIGGDVVAGIESVAGVGRRDLWIATSHSHYGRCGDPLPASAGSVYATTTIAVSTDSGASWSRSTLPRCADADQLTFVNRSDGWALSELPKSTALYATSDGGTSWKLVDTPPFAGPIAFSTSRDGWGVRGSTLYKTTDGGASWARVALPAPATLTRSDGIVRYGTPDFLSRDVGFIPALLSKSDHTSARFGVYATTDGGRIWVLHLAPDDAAYSTTPISVPWSAISPTDWFVYVGPTLYLTTNAGKSWRWWTPRPKARPPTVEAMTFTSRSVGWALFEGPDGTRLARTTDGGVTWRFAT